MDLLQVDVNQCDDKFYRPNAFKDTHKCDKKTSYVSYSIILNNNIYYTRCSKVILPANSRFLRLFRDHFSLVKISKH